MGGNAKSGNFMLAVLISQFLSYYAVSAAKGVFELTVEQRLTLISAISFGPPLLAYFLLCKKGRPPKKSLSLKNLLYAATLTICAYPVMSLVSAVSSNFFNNDVAYTLVELSSRPVWATLVSMCAVPALLEEAVFRGVILENYKERPILHGAIVSGLFFGLVHQNLQQFFYAFIMGVFLGVLAGYTKSIWAPVLSHFMVNAASTLLLYALKGAELMTAPLPVDMLAVICGLLALSAYWFMVIFKRFAAYNRENALGRTPGGAGISLSFILALFLYAMLNLAALA